MHTFLQQCDSICEIVNTLGKSFDKSATRCGQIGGFLRTTLERLGVRQRTFISHDVSKTRTVSFSANCANGRAVQAVAKLRRRTRAMRASEP